MAKWISYQEDILKIYNLMRKSGEIFRDDNGNCLHLFETPGTKKLSILAFSKRNGDGIYVVDRVDALDDWQDETDGEFKNKHKVILPKLFHKPISRFIPMTYDITRKKLEGRIIIYREGSKQNPINMPFKNELKRQIEKLSKEKK